MTSYASNRDSTMRRTILIMQTLFDYVSEGWSAVRTEMRTHNPPQAKIPVKVSFCLWVVRRRHSRGKGCENTVSG